MTETTLYSSEREERANDAFEHSENGYANHGCRGPICRRAHALVTATTRAARRAYVAKYGLPPGVEHGASAYTNWGCRCPEVCRPAHAEETNRYRGGRYRTAR